MKHQPIIVLANKEDISKHMPRLADIASQYYPMHYDVSKMLQNHLNAGGILQVALIEGDIAGFSVSSCEIRITPFNKREMPVIYQRLLFIDTALRRQLLGISLQIAVLHLHLGPFWLFKRLTLFCLTDNPLIVRAFDLYNIYYPNNQITPTPEVWQFCESLLPLLFGNNLGKNLLVYGTNESMLKDFDYTHWWKKYLASGHTYYDELLLSTVFKPQQGRILHSGALLLVVGYSRPLNLLKRFLQIAWKQLSESFTGK